MLVADICPRLRPRAYAPLLLVMLLRVTCMAGLDADQSCEEPTLATEALDQASFFQHAIHHSLEGDGAKAGVASTLLDHEGMEVRGDWEPPSEVGEGWSSQHEGIPLLLRPESHLREVVGMQTGGAKNGVGNGIRAISFITVHDPFFNTNLAKSSVWLHRHSLPHEWLLLDNRKGRAISELYARAQVLTTNDILVFLHSDVILPDTFYRDFMEKLNLIESKDPKWGVLGTAGVPEGYPESAPDGFPEATMNMASCITDNLHTYNTGVDSLPVQALDESLLVIRRAGGPSFDLHLPGFDLYGSDIVLSARKLGMKSYLLNLPVMHKTVEVDGQAYNAKKFDAKIASPEYKARVKTTTRYLEKKWCKSGFLPTQGTVFKVTQPAACD